MRVAWILVLLGAVAGGDEPKLDLPRVERAPGKDDGKLGVVVRIDAKHRVWANVENLGTGARAWKQVTLDELGAHLDRRRRRFDRRENEAGRKSYNEQRSTLLPLTLEVDAAVPWRHVDWVMTIADGQLFFDVRFAMTCNGKPCRLRVPVAERGGSRPMFRPPPTLAKLVVFSATIRGGADARFAVMDGETVPRAELLRLARAKHEAARDPATVFRADVRAGAKTPAGVVLTTVAALREIGYTFVHCHDGEHPPVAAMRSKELAAPQDDELPRSVSGELNGPRIRRLKAREG